MQSDYRKSRYPLGRRSLGFFAICVMLFAVGLMHNIFRGILSVPDITLQYFFEVGDAFAFLLGTSLSIIAILLIISRHEFFGTLIFQEDQFVITAPLKRKIVMKYENIRDIGIACTANIPKQYWIFMSTSRLEGKYRTAINTMTLNSEHIKIEYSERMFEILVAQLPKRLSRTLESCKWKMK